MFYVKHYERIFGKMLYQSSLLRFLRNCDLHKCAISLLNTHTQPLLIFNTHLVPKNHAKISAYLISVLNNTVS